MFVYFINSSIDIQEAGSQLSFQESFAEPRRHVLFREYLMQLRQRYNDVYQQYNNQFIGEINENLVEGSNVNVNRGLTTQRIEKFGRFALDESTVGHKCLVCQDDPAIGTRMVRLDCHVDHVFCEQCAVPWFEGHNTCPTCRQAFS